MERESDGVLSDLEEAFEISFHEAECWPLETYRDLFELIAYKVPRAEQERCLSAVAFHRVRRALVKAFGVDRADVRPSSRLEDVLGSAWSSHGERRATWRRFEAALGVPLLELERSGLVVWACVGVCAAILLATLLAASGSEGRWEGGVVAIAVAFFLGGATLAVRSHLPAGIVDVGDLVDALLLRHPRGLVPEGRLTRGQLGWVLPRIIADRSGVALEKVTARAKLAEILD